MPSEPARQLHAVPEPAATVQRLAAPAQTGHYDELRHADGSLRPSWQQFFDHLGPGGFAELPRRYTTIARRIREDGITYNVYGDDGGAARPWSLDLLPYLIAADEWKHIEAGVAQRAALLSAIMCDVYGPQRLLAEGLLPPALVVGNPGYLRPLVGCAPAGGVYLHILSFDLARAADGAWWIVGQRTQAPSGLGYALQNRLIVSRLFPDAFREMRVQRLASSYRRLLDTLQRLSPRDPEEPPAPRLVLLTPGPYSETYFEHAYLARYLGIPLVEGGDLTVRDDRVFLKTLHGLARVHCILRRLDDDYCDPVELRADSTLGVPGLVEAIRAGQVLVANALGSGFLESPAINGFLPPIARRELGQELLLPALPSWWCGERAAYEHVAGALGDKVIKPTYPATPHRPGFEPVIGAELDAAQQDFVRERIEADPDACTVQGYVPLPQAPTWHDGGIVPRAAMLRVFAIALGGGRWHVMPGGLTRVAGREQLIVSMQRGGSSQDTWVRTEGKVDTFSMLPSPLKPEDLARKRRIVTSRAAENLFWMGRYAERAEVSVRLASAVLTLLGGDAREPSPLLDALGTLAEQQGLVPPGAPSPAQSTGVFERTLIASLTSTTEVHSVAFNLAALARTAGHIRDRLSADHWRLVAGAAQGFAADCAGATADGSFSSDEALAALDRLAVRLAAITGAQTDHMTRDDGWRLLTVGRHLERLAAQAGALYALFEAGAAARDDGFELLLLLFDSTITYRSLYQRGQEMPPLLDLLILETANPRALRGVAAMVSDEIAHLGAHELARHLPAAHEWPSLEALCETDAEGTYAAVLDLSARLVSGACALSDAIGERYFSHAFDAFRTVRA